MILQETINSVFARMDIVDVVGSFVQLKRAGANYKGLSPFNKERTPSFMVSPQKGIFKCFSSGKGGNALNFIMEHEHLTYPEAIKWFCNRYGIEYLETEKNDAEAKYEREREALLIITEAAQEYFIRNATMTEMGRAIYERGISEASQVKFGIGIAPGTVAGLCQYLITERGMNWELCIQASMIKYKDRTLYDTFRNRIMFPIRNVSGRIEGFGGRAISWSKGDRFPKYLNSSDSIIYNKGNVVYGLYESKKAIAENNLCYLSEGYTDVIGFHDIGIENIVAVSGTSFTAEQARLIKRFTNNLTVLFDGDDAGIRAALRGIDIALSEGISVKVCVLPDGQDPDDYRKGKTREQVLEYITANSKDFIVFKLNYLLKNVDDFTERGQAITEVMASVAKVKNPIQREVYVKECARVTDIDIEPLKMMMNQAMLDNREFYDIPAETFEEITNDNSFLMEQCEARLLQYLLCYKNVELAFKEVYYVQTNFGLVEEFNIIKTTVHKKIDQDILGDGIEFTNVLYQQIFNIAFQSDISDVSRWPDIFGAELFLTADRLRVEEEAMHLTSFAKEGQKTYEYVMKSRQEHIQNGLSETIIFLRILIVENMISEQMRQEQPDQQEIFTLIQFSNDLKQKLNFL